MISLYRPGTSIVHRLSAAVKLTGLAVIALVLSLYPHDAISIAVALGIVAVMFVIARVPRREFCRQLWQLRVLIIVLAVFLAIFVSPLAAWINTGRVVAIVLLAGLLTLTTRMSDLLGVINLLLLPLRRFGVNPAGVSMAISLCITMVPVIAAQAARIREAQQARDVRLGIGVVVPLLVMALRHADDVGDAMTARGMG
ncbi:energy-coupling factor transporter transmembrane protein EcfT [Microbacterium sp.]|uniref:energy-coupling factor transporter transmembrane component T family protein n=1 Tax=Microbacterium sp. TaxID=51671 RepID=UPI0026285377|nr:energy-coupling factor transporter transmembrane protein EcfT [Microbacterium sp.]